LTQKLAKFWHILRELKAWAAQDFKTFGT